MAQIKDRIKLTENRRNYIGTLTNDEAADLGSMITSVSLGNIKGNVRIYHTKGSGSTVRDYLKKFGNKYPYSSILNYGTYITYDCKKKGDSKQANQANGLLNELKQVIAFRYVIVKKEDTINDDGTEKPGIENPTTDYDNTNNSESESNNIILYIGIGVVAFILFYFILRK